MGELSILSLVMLSLFVSRHTIQPQRSSYAWKPPLFSRSSGRADGERSHCFPCAASSCAWLPILLSGEVDTAHHTNYLRSKHVAFMLHLENADVFINRVVQHKSTAFLVHNRWRSGLPGGRRQLCR